MENIVIALLGVIGSFITSSSLINWRLGRLEKKVDEHNNYAEKFGECLTEIAVIKNDIQYIKEKIK